MKIHDHPQKAEYKDDGSDWPLLEAQGHWPELDPIVAGHLHVGVKFPKGAEITSATGLVVPFTLKLHDFPGYIGMFFGRHAATITWDDTGTTTPPPMQGASAVLKQWSGKVALDFFLGQEPWLGDIGMLPLHGWTGSFFTARAVMDNGDTFEVQLVLDFFSAIDLTQPERQPAQQGIPGQVFSSRVTVSNKDALPSTTLAGNRFGVMVTEVNGYIPFADMPIDKPWTSIVNFYNYTSDQVLPNGKFRQVLDADLHNENPGTTLDSDTAGVLGVPNRPFVIDPAVMGAGAHKELLFWTQTANGETISSVLNFPVTVGPSVPPPPPPTTTGVPVLVGLTQDAALVALQNARLVSAVTTATDATVPAGNVVSQSPAGGTVVDVNSAVTLVVSTGPTPPPAEEWVSVNVNVTQQSVGGVLQQRWRLHDGAAFVEVVPV
jgi:hypothetical protein